LLWSMMKCVSILTLLVGFCCLSSGSILSSVQSINATYVDVPRPSYIPSDWEAATYGSLMGIGDNVYMFAAFILPTGTESYLYEFNSDLELTSTLNLTYINSEVAIGYDSTFGNSFNKQIYMLSQTILVQVDSVSMQVVNTQTFSEALIDGFSNYQGSEVVYFGSYQNEVGFMVLSATNLAFINFYALDLPSGYQWAAYPYCRPSNIDQTLAYCSCELIAETYVLYTFSLSLTTFKMLNYIETSGDLVVAYPDSSSTADLFILSDYEASKVYYYNLTGYTSTLQVVWQVELPTNTDAVYSIQSAGNSIIVSIIQTKTYANVLLEYDSNTGELIGQWQNTTPCDLVFDDSTPAPFYESNGNWNLIGLGLPEGLPGILLANIDVTGN